MNGTTNRSSRSAVPSYLTFGLFVVVLLTFALTGCSSAGLADRLAEGKAWQASCPAGRILATDVRIDASGSSAMTDISGDLEKILRDAAARTAICSGRLSVRAFAGSSAGTALLYDRALSLPQATDNARFLAVKGVQDDVLRDVSKNYGEISGLHGGSDIAAQYRNARELIDQLGPDYQLVTLTYTDGRQNVGPVDPAQADDDVTAEDLAEQVVVPLLTGADISVVGLGNVNGIKDTSRVTENLVRFYAVLCRRMAAARCTVATDYVSPVGR